METLDRLEVLVESYENQFELNNRLAPTSEAPHETSYSAAEQVLGTLSDGLPSFDLEALD